MSDPLNVGTPPGQIPHPPATSYLGPGGVYGMAWPNGPGIPGLIPELPPWSPGPGIAPPPMYGGPPTIPSPPTAGPIFPRPLPPVYPWWHNWLVPPEVPILPPVFPMMPLPLYWQNGAPIHPLYNPPYA